VNVLNQNKYATILEKGEIFSLIVMIKRAYQSISFDHIWAPAMLVDKTLPLKTKFYDSGNSCR